MPGETKADPKIYASGQPVRWCPGCGDYAILKAAQKALAAARAPRERTVFVSGIGCASRFPYYMSTYGMHTIHGRAPAFATGVKFANPELDVWIVVGDGDGLSIGANHLFHVLRRNLNVQILLFNNEIYGLTKGQASPTSPAGIRTPSTPRGSTEMPANAARFALGAGATFIARAIDTDKDLPQLLLEARSHRGAAFVEIYQNCPVYNDGAFDSFAARETAVDFQLRLGNGAPLRYGKDLAKGLRMNGSGLLEEVKSAPGGGNLGEVAVHDRSNSALAWNLAGLNPPSGPKALGVLYQEGRPTHDDAAKKPGGSRGAASDRDRFAAIRDAIAARGTWNLGGQEGDRPAPESANGGGEGRP